MIALKEKLMPLNSFSNLLSRNSISHQSSEKTTKKKTIKFNKIYMSQDSRVNYYCDSTRISYF